MLDVEALLCHIMRLSLAGGELIPDVMILLCRYRSKEPCRRMIRASDDMTSPAETCLGCCSET